MSWDSSLAKRAQELGLILNGDGLWAPIGRDWVDGPPVGKRWLWRRIAKSDESIRFLLR